jgi:hypothetical protein
VVDLVEAELEDEAQVGGLLVGGFAGQIIDAGVEAALAAEGAVGEFGDQAAIERWNVFVEDAIEGHICKRSFANLAERLEGNLTGGLGFGGGLGHRGK